MLRISIWQQFSSNHSADFTIVGEFESPEAAEQAADRVQAFFDSINEWFARPENRAVSEMRAESQMYRAPVSDPEREISQQFGIRWHENSIDWLAMRPGRVPNILGNHVFIQPRLTSQGGGALASLFTKFGGKWMIGGDVTDQIAEPYEFRSLDITLIFVIPDELTVRQIRQELEEFQSNYDSYMAKALSGNRENLVKKPVAPWATPEIPSWLDVAVTFVASLSAEWIVDGRQIRLNHIKLNDLGDSIIIFTNWLKRLGCTELKLSVIEQIDE